MCTYVAEKDRMPRGNEHSFVKARKTEIVIGGFPVYFSRTGCSEINGNGIIWIIPLIPLQIRLSNMGFTDIINYLDSYGYAYNNKCKTLLQTLLSLKYIVYILNVQCT